MKFCRWNPSLILLAAATSQTMIFKNRRCECRILQRFEFAERNQALGGYSFVVVVVVFMVSIQRLFFCCLNSRMTESGWFHGCGFFSSGIMKSKIEANQMRDDVMIRFEAGC